MVGTLRNTKIALMTSLYLTMVVTFVVCSIVVSAHRQILGMASVVCVLVKICASSVSLDKLDPDKLTNHFNQHINLP